MKINRRDILSSIENNSYSLDLSGYDLSCLNLADISFHSHSKFESCNLCETDFSGAKIKWAVFNRIEAERSVFSNAELDMSSFRGAKLQRCSFKGASINRTRFSGADLINADFSYCKGLPIFAVESRDDNDREEYKKPACLNQANFSHADFWNYGFGIDAAHFEGCQVRSSNFSNAKVWGYFNYSDLTDANFSGSFLEKACFYGANCTRTSFVNANMRKCDLKEVDLTTANLQGAQLQGAIYNSGTVWPPGFVPIAAGAIKESR